MDNVWPFHTALTPNGWPFKYVNGVQTEESKALEAEKPSKPDPYQLALLETEQQEALL